MTAAVGERRAAADVSLRPAKRIETSISPPQQTRPIPGSIRWWWVINQLSAPTEARWRRWSAASAWPCWLHTLDKTGWVLRGIDRAKGITVRDAKTAFGTLDCPPLGETLLTITITFHLIICMVYKDINVQPCDLFLPTVVFLPFLPYINTPRFDIV